MALGAAVLAGTSLVGNYIQGKGKQRAARAQARGIGQATADANAMRQPWMQAGTQALQGYQDLMTQEGQANFADQYTSGPMFQEYQQQAEDATLRGASATGGLRTGQSNVALSTIAPQLITQAYNQQLQGFMPLMNQGYSATENAANTAYGGGVAATTPQYAANTAMSDFAGNAVSSLGGFAYNQMGGMGGGSPASNFNLGDSFSSMGMPGIGTQLSPTQTSVRPGQRYGR